MLPKILWTLLFIALMYSCASREPRYELCTIISPNKIYKVIERDDYYIRNYDGALHFYQDGKKISLTEYSMSCEPTKVKSKNE